MTTIFEKQTAPDGRYAIVEFTVGYFEAGEFVAYEDVTSYLWQGMESWDDVFLPAGKEVVGHKDKYSPWDKEQDGIILQQDAFAIVAFVIVGNAVGGNTSLSHELDGAGMCLFDDHCKEILAMAAALPLPEKRNLQHSSFLTLWRVVYESYTSLDSMWDEYDMWLELLGPVNLPLLVK